ncbi:hypothetical protein KA119_02525 [Candidatus Gracilibacteria bacterium]|nr:hypothetical protein [Candidatus Gracilibacteria bacterium]
MPEWAKTISPNNYIAIHSLRGAVDGNLRQTVHEALINIAFPPYQIVQNHAPPFKEALLKYPDNQHILIIIEATRRHDLGATIDVHIDEYIRTLNAEIRQRIMIIALIDKRHAHAYDHYHWGIINPLGPQQLYEKLQTYGIKIIYADHDQIIAQLKAKLLEVIVP